MKRYIRDEELYDYAKKTAAELKIGSYIRGRRLAAGINKNIKLINKNTAEISRLAALMTRVPQEAEWLLDNRYIAERDAKNAALGIKHSGKLPCCLGGKALAAEAAKALLCAGDWRLSENRLESFLKGFQTERALTEKEIYLFPSFIVAALTEKLSALSDKVRDMLEEISEKSGESIFYIEQIYKSGERRDEQTAKAAEQAEEAHKEMTQIAESIFSSLRFIASSNISARLEKLGKMEEILNNDPAGVYPKMDRESRASYRRALAALSEKSNMSELEAAKRVVKLAEQRHAHIGEFIFNFPLGTEKKERKPWAYIWLNVLPAVLISVITALAARSAAVGIISFVPIFEWVRQICDYLVLKFTRPQRLLRMEEENGIPENAKTICAVVSLLNSEEAAERYARLLEEYRLCNSDAGSGLMFAMLSDLAEAKDEQAESDGVYISAAQSRINALNEKYGGGFYLFTRRRKYSERDGIWRAWERKRGAIMELAACIGGKKSGLDCRCGDTSALSGIKYMIVLDADTRLTTGSALELVSIMEHPLNRAVIDERSKTVNRGYGILQPRVALDLAAAQKSEFAAIYGGQGGIDPYGSVCCDVYQDLFESGSFTGKGIISVEVMNKCLYNRLPEERILSHDLLEGAYIKSGFAGSVELTDGFPSRLSAYFERMHRWIRGDWQILPWLFKTVPTRGGREKNPLNALNRWKIFDNLRRSLTAPLCFVCFAFSACSGAYMLAAAAAVHAIAARLLTGLADLMSRPGELAKRHYITRLTYGIPAALMQIFMRLVYLPFEAFISASAIITALYRMIFSKKHLLQWITAEEAERKGEQSVVSYCKKMWFSVLAGVVLAVFSPFVVWKAAGAVWIFAPVIAFLMSRERGEKTQAGDSDSRFLKRCAGDIWRFFEDYLTAERNFLPPDNIQEEPEYKIAERTSPTNIGLALLSALAALDMGLTSRERAAGLIKNMLSSVERLEKWNGLLYNWYDIKTMQPLRPEYVSSVDCGNYAACLTALKTALEGMGENELAETVERMLDECDLSPLYDSEKKLFSIGYDVSSGTLSEGRYDLMVSEARLMSYLAIARGWADKKHWRSLSRVLARDAGVCGMASWTGSVFEYFMPSLLLPNYYGSLMDDTLRLCVSAQKRASKPWGISESAFYSFDSMMNYKYKAHGVQAIALRRGMDAERVVSPYSSFLASAYDVRGAVKNLKRLMGEGMEGRYGFFEAFDKTPDRAGGGEAVKCFMAHHLGMSIVAIDNAVNGEIMRKRFMSEPKIAAYRELLQEKGPVGQVISREKNVNVSQKPDRMPARRWRAELKDISVNAPRCCVLANGAYKVIISELGVSSSEYRGKSVTHFTARRFGAPEGISFYLFINGRLYPLQAAPEYDPDIKYFAEMETDRCLLFSSFNGIECCVETAVSKNENGERRVVTVKNRSRQNIEAELICYFEPVLAKKRDYEAHPAFSKLIMETGYTNGAVTAVRRPGSSSGEAMACAVSCDKVTEYDTFKQQTFGRGGLRALKSALSKPAGMTLGAALDPCVLLRVKLSLQPGGEEKARFALACAKDASSAAEMSGRILGKGFKYSRAVERAAAEAELSPNQTDSAMAALSTAIFGYGGEGEEYSDKHSLGRGGLWRFGISGDEPVFAASIDKSDVNKAAEVIREHMFLTSCGVKIDLALIINDGGDYFSPARTMISQTAASLGRAGYIDAPCGIHIVEGSAAEVKAVLAMADYIYDKEPKERAPQSLIRQKYFLSPKVNNRVIYEPQYNNDGSVSFETGGGLGDTVWSNMLTNGDYGYLATDCGSGFMWRKNAREGRINPWTNDFLADGGSEILRCENGGESISLFAACDGWDTRVTFGFGYAEWDKRREGKRIKTTAFVPMNKSARVMIIETSGFLGEVNIRQSLSLTLGEGSGESKTVFTQRTGDSFSARSADAEAFKAVYTQCCNMSIESFASNPYGLGKTEVVYSAGDIGVIVSGTDERDEIKALAEPKNARKALEAAKAYWNGLTSAIRVETPSEKLNNYMNGWAIYQVIACRIMGRTSMYQSGGAYGYRDQLQDACSIASFFPELTKKQIIRAAAHQYLEGDVQHWWHEGDNGDRGVRTRCSDDLIWLPYAVCRYISVSGDTGILNETADYLASPELLENDKDRYEKAEKAGREETILRHCERALDRVIERGTGGRGLLYIGAGDWNDGFDKIGGESEWLTWFAAMVMRDLAPYCGEENAKRYLSEAQKLAAAANSAWDGEWYIRGTWADGEAFGGAESEECRIDSIAQSFAVISALGDKNRAADAVNKAYDMLFDSENGVVRLFDPPFNGAGREPGYIMGYLPGVRENGGQYTHAAVWLALALLRCGEKEKGWNILNALLPGGRDGTVYKVEPYVISADVYYNPQHIGRGGWSWYTGAAGWMFQTVCEELLGIKKVGGKLATEPKLPPEWQGFEAWTNGEHITVSQNGAKTEREPTN